MAFQCNLIFLSLQTFLEANLSVKVVTYLLIVVSASLRGQIIIISPSIDEILEVSYLFIACQNIRKVAFSSTTSLVLGLATKINLTVMTFLISTYCRHICAIAQKPCQFVLE